MNLPPGHDQGQAVGLPISLPCRQSITAGLLLPGADFAAQLIEKNKAASQGDEEGGSKPLDLGRTARFAIFGFLLQAPWNHFYYLVLDQLIPPSPDPLSATTLTKVFIDQGLQVRAVCGLVRWVGHDREGWAAHSMSGVTCLGLIPDALGLID